MKNWIYLIMLIDFLAILGAFRLGAHWVAVALSVLLVLLTIFLFVGAVVADIIEERKKGPR